MPWPTARLNRRSSKKAIDNAISDCISFVSDEHPDWDHDRVVAACHSDARSHAGAAKVPKK